MSMAVFSKRLAATSKLGLIAFQVLDMLRGIVWKTMKIESLCFEGLLRKEFEKAFNTLFIHSLPKVKHRQENANFQKPIRIEDDAIRCRGRWKYANMLGNSQSCIHVKKYEKAQSYKKPAL
ncbi:uncharacterized protein TNCV_4119521 [Trichonephila clavipes]|nr:uncharacterized protein TNCV_4119521 [Trichonephila clavipes]